jgi:tetratricopeptide (TPR) repeat protein
MINDECLADEHSSGQAPLDETPPDERIAVLTDLLASADAGDRPELNGLLGDAYLDLYYESATGIDHLIAAVECIESAMAAAPDHADALWWHYRLALAYAERATRTDATADHDRAIDLLHTVAQLLPPGDVDRDVTLASLIDAYWDRSRMLARTSAITLDEARRAAAVIELLVVDIADEKIGAYGRLVAGMAKLTTYDESDHRPDLDAGIEALATALEAVAPDTPRYVAASAHMCRAYLSRSWLDDDPASTALAIKVGQRAVGTAAPDDPALSLLYYFLAQACQDRWEVTEEPEDLSSAIRCWRRVVDDEPDGHALTQCGVLLRQRAEVLQDPEDAGEATRLLERAVLELDTAWFELAKAHRVEWQCSRTPGSLERAADCIDRVLAKAPPPDDWLLLVHNERLEISRSRMDYELERFPSEAPRSALLMRGHVADARIAWQQTAVDGSPDLRAILATMLAATEMYSGVADPGSVDMERVNELLTFGRTVQDPPPGWSAVLDGCDAVVQYVQDAVYGGHRDGGLEPLVRGIGGTDTDPDFQAHLWQLVPVVLIGRALRSGDRRTLRTAVNQLLTATDDPDFRMLGELVDLMDRAQHGDAAVAADVRRLAAHLRESRPSLVVRQAVVPMLSMLEQAFDGLDGRPWDLDRTPLVPVKGLAAVETVGAALSALVGPITTATVRHDVPALRECATRVVEVAALVRDEPTMRLIIAGLGGLAELEVARNDPGDRAAARRAAAWWQESASIAGGPQHPLWSRIAMCQGEALRLAGDPDRSLSRRLGLSALRGFVWQVLLQSGTDDAVSVAVDACAAATTVANWCRADGADSDLVTALDAGRGLVLHAASTSRTVADQLTDAGRADLAEQWLESAGFGRDAITGGLLGALAAGPEVPDDLRARVLQALGADDPIRGGTFTPVRLEEIRSALSEVGADALVYLVPATTEQSGAAVVVPASSGVDTVVLPDLAVGPHTMVGRYAASGGVRDAGPVDGTGDETGPSVDDVCRWAWSAAVGPLLRHAGRWDLRRPVRFVLIPMGLLATVPWHGAFRQDAQGRHYAVKQAVFSYTVSARNLCATAQSPGRPIRSALVVGDPNGDLPFAGVEGQAIWRAFYPDGIYLGRPTGTGTPEHVLDWIAEAAPGPSLLHLACHGRVDPASPGDAHLVLAGDTLTARRLLDASRIAELAIERVFLAACTTAVTASNHDEAFSLSTAVLAAGARTVFGSLWSVPDAETSLLMFLVHHFLNAESRAPVDALHHAQLWMLDPQRRPPPGMPPELARYCGSDNAADPVSWAAFTHQGR